MGYYINPTESTLEDYILKNSIRMSKEDFANYKYTGKSQPYLPVCVVHNGDFMAAGVAVDAAERNRFIHPDDHRPKRFFLMAREDLGEKAGLGNVIEKYF